MNKKIINTIQEKILNILPKDCRNQPGIFLKDSCSEVSRLVAGWIKEVDQPGRVYILKGSNIFNTKKSHDIIAWEDLDSRVYIIDPTVWQFFPKTKSILIFTCNNLKNAFKKISAKYGGQCVKNEEINKVSKKDIKKYLYVINKNIQENSRRD